MKRLHFFYHRNRGIWKTPCLELQWHDLWKGPAFYIGPFMVAVKWGRGN